MSARSLGARGGGGGAPAALDESVEMRLDATLAEKRLFAELAELYSILQGACLQPWWGGMG